MRTVRLIGLSLLVFAAAFAQPARPQAQDEEFARLVKEWTTRPEFMSPLVDHLPKAAGVPSPKDVLGYYIGAPKKLTHVADLNRYYRALAAASPRVKVFSGGHHRRGPRVPGGRRSRTKTPSAISIPTKGTWRAWPIRAG